MENASLPPVRSVTVRSLDRPNLHGYDLLPADGGDEVEASRRGRLLLDLVRLGPDVLAAAALLYAFYAIHASLSTDGKPDTSVGTVALVVAVGSATVGHLLWPSARARLERPLCLHRDGRLLASWRAVGRHRWQLAGPDGRVLCRMRRQTLWHSMLWHWCFEAADGRLLLRYKTGIYTNLPVSVRPEALGSEWMDLAIVGRPPDRLEYRSEDDVLGLGVGVLCLELYHRRL